MSTYSTEAPGALGSAQADLLAKRAYDSAMNRYQLQRGNTLSKYGYTRDAGGNIGVDPNNEYGQYQTTLKGEAGQNEALQRRQAASGWDSGSGYLGAQQDELQHAQGAEQANLGKAATAELTSVDQGEQDAAFTRDQALYQNQLDAANAAANANQFNPADYTGIDQPGYGEIPNPQPAAPKKASTKAVPKKVTAAAHTAAKKQLIKKVRGRR